MYCMNINSGHLYLLSSLLRTHILMIHMVFWETYTVHTGQFGKHQKWPKLQN